MSFLERFKPQPKHKSTDPEVRLAGVHELGPDPDDVAVLVGLAREDADARVRRAAAARVENVSVLASIALSDPDEALRAETADRLTAIASGDRQDLARQALGALRDQKYIGTVARTSPLEAIRTEAIGRLSDPKALSAVARHTADGRAAALATERIQDRAELLNIAAKTDHKDAGVSALERAMELSLDRQELEGLATRAKNKSVSRRARTMLQAIDDAEAARRETLERNQQRLKSALERIEALAAAPADEQTTARLADAEAEWRVLLEDAPVEPAADERSRFVSATTAVQASVARAAEERARQLELAEQLATVRSSKLALCERVDALRGEALLDELAAARGEWEGLPSGPEPDQADAELLNRFEEACRRATERHENRQETERVNSRLDALSIEAEQLASQEDSPAYAWEAVEREWNDLEKRSDGLDESIRQRFATADAAIKARDEAKRAAAEKVLRQQVQRLDQLVERATKRATAEDLTLREADKAARDLRAGLESPPALPYVEREKLVDRLKTALAGLAPKLHELREMDEWKRFANAAVQEELIAQTEALRTKFDLEKARRSREGRSRAPRDSGTLEAGRGSAACAGADAVAPLSPGGGPAAGQGARVLRAARRGAAGQPGKEARALRAGGSAGRFDRLDQDGRRVEEASARMAGDRPGASSGHPRGLEAIPRSVRSILQPPQRRPRAAEGSLGDEPGEERSLVRPRGTTGRVARVGARGRGDPSAAGRLEDDRSRAPEQVRSVVAALPCRMRSLLRPLQAARRDRTRSPPGGSRSACRRARGTTARRRGSPGNHPPICSSASDRCARAGTSPRRQSSRAPIR